MFKFSLDSTWHRAYSDFEHVQHPAGRRHEMITPNNIIVVTYLAYLLISVTLTIWVARTLYRRGAIFLVDAFHGNRELADSVNHLLVVGFYLINVGYVTLALHTAAQVETARSAIELVCDKIGLVLIVLGVMHFF